MRRIATVLVAALPLLSVTVPMASASDPDILRLAGGNRYSTAVAVAQHYHPDGASIVFVASGVTFPDGLAGAAAAGRMGAPLLLTEPGVLPPETRAEIIRLDPDVVYLVGGPSAVSPEVLNELISLAPTARISGPNRFATAVQVSRLSYPTGGIGVVVVATGFEFADALAGAPAATALGGPVLLTHADALTAATRAEIIRLQPDEILLLGGTAAVSAQVFAELSTIAPTTRLAGANRYETAVAVSLYAFPQPTHGFVAVGTGFPDALAGAAAAAALRGPVLLTERASLPPQVLSELKRSWPHFLAILGGTAVVSSPVEDTLTALITPPLSTIELGLDLIADGFDEPLFVASRPGDPRLFVVEKAGLIWSMTQSGEDRALVLDISAGVVTFGEHGLLGIAFDPGDPSRLFLHYSAPHPDPDPPDGYGVTTLEEYDFPLQDAVVNPAPVATYLTLEQTAHAHNGGSIEFGPDGLLYVALGDGGNTAAHRLNGQDPTTLEGSILRLDMSTHPYSIPPGNPFTDGANGAPEVWAYGLRNPWRISFDGADLYVSDVGQNQREEVTVLPPGAAGANLGWAVLEGTRCFDGGNPLCADNEFVAPTYEYQNEAPVRCAITGGYVARSLAQRVMRGVYIFGDYCSGEIMGIRVVAGVVVDSRVFDAAIPRLSSFGVDQSGRLYAVSYQTGEIHRVVTE